MTRLNDRVAIITGSSSGIGRGVAIAFAAAGARVVVNYPGTEELQAAGEVVDAIEQAGGRAIAVRADVAKEPDAAALVEATLDTFGAVHILVNNAGVAHSAPLEQIPPDVWDHVIAVHLRGTFLMTRRVLPLMYAQDYGRIVNTVSQLAYKGAPGFTHYTAAKGAILSLSRSLALEIGARNVNVNCVAPGATRTRMLADVPEPVLEAIRQSIPKGRLAEVEDIVPAYLFLASDESRHFQGQCLSPNGGDVFL